jgi:hypothetical protein
MLIPFKNDPSVALTRTFYAQKPDDLKMYFGVCARTSAHFIRAADHVTHLLAPATRRRICVQPGKGSARPDLP